MPLEFDAASCYQVCSRVKHRKCNSLITHLQGCIVMVLMTGLGIVGFMRSPIHHRK